MNAVAKLTSSVTPLSAGQMGFGPGGPLPAPTPWTTYGTWLQWSGGIVLGNPTGGNMGPGSINVTSYFINGAPFDLGNYLPLTGGIIGGSLTINGALTVVSGPVNGLVLDMGTY